MVAKRKYALDWDARSSQGITPPWQPLTGNICVNQPPQESRAEGNGTGAEVTLLSHYYTVSLCTDVYRLLSYSPGFLYALSGFLYTSRWMIFVSASLSGTSFEKKSCIHYIFIYLGKSINKWERMQFIVFKPLKLPGLTIGLKGHPSIS